MLLPRKVSIGFLELGNIVWLNKLNYAIRFSANINTVTKRTVSAAKILLGGIGRPGLFPPMQSTAMELFFFSKLQ